ncbi:MAG: hypothetical protein NTX50_07185 [Candidatus Sumerlaeota bacterium]|nr:hypothetical protein [Candidatus Sumerlaeota bacterium]
MGIILAAMVIAAMSGSGWAGEQTAPGTTSSAKPAAKPAIMPAAQPAAGKSASGKSISGTSAPGAAVFGVFALKTLTTASTGALTVNYLLGKSATPPAGADANKDSKIAIADVVALSRATATPHPTPTPHPSLTPGAIQEIEPNDTLATAQSLGSVQLGQTLVINGRLSSGGMNGQQYTGDPDFYSFTLPAQMDVRTRVTWAAGADVDVFVIYQGYIIASFNGADTSLDQTGTLNAGTFSLLLVSKNNAADYQITLTFSASTATYANDNSLLNGTYTKPGSTAFLEWYIFDGVSQYEYWNWTEVTGNKLKSSGTYQVWYPFLVLYHDSTREYHLLGFKTPPPNIYIDTLEFEKG